jgi:hypothetical protein
MNYKNLIYFDGQKSDHNSKLEPGFVNQQVQNDNNQTLLHQKNVMDNYDDFVNGGQNQSNRISLQKHTQHFSEETSKSILNNGENRSKKSKSGLLVYTASELLTEFNGKETDFLWDNLVPRVGTGLLVGQPDLGKSQLAKELAIMLAKGSSEYLGLKLNPFHNHVLYVFTEDQEEGVSSSLHKQLIKHSDLDKSKLSLAFLRDESIVELIKKIDAFCTETPIDLVIIDAFGDIFSGSDSNNNIQMRRDIKAFDDVVRRHNICVLFVHHVNKSGYNKNPSQELIQGGSGLTQKVRFALFLSRNDDGQKFLNVAKGNYSSKYYKENRLPIDFDEGTLTFDVFGEWEPINNNKKGKKEDLTDISLYSLMKNDGYTYSSLSSKIMVFLSISKSTAERRIAALLKDKKVIKHDDLYYHTEANVEHSSVATITSNILEKNEGDGDTAFPHTDEFNITTLNPQTLIDFEGEGTKARDITIDEIQHPTIKSRFIESEIDQSTVNPQNLLGNEGEGNSDWHNELQSNDVIVQANDYPIDPNIQLIREKIAQTDYVYDENFCAAMEQCYMDAPRDLAESEMSEKDFFCVLQDNHNVDNKQAKFMIQTLINMKIIRINDNGFIRLHSPYW